ncbi:hypothetical protein FDH41_gp09 [Acinetobacter phage WCHABP12]|uniref:Uncharacterized protein n=1 Tax=Acinetobacter phage WCHABP12 TaxID=1965454 RepID=A0A1V0DZ52_9CAUD|nr:hypothetical protein FDH41_gp09 [Acinetobacter phage WCHABP12]ARB06750.1 hypothetical protein ABP12_00009 [Acinetobacter phage WCHABP12]
MKLAMLVYFASLSTGLCAFLMLVGLILIAVFGAVLINRSVTNDVYDHDADYAVKKRNQANSAFKAVKKFGLIGPLLIALSILIPSEKTIYIMAGAYATEQIASNERVQKIGSDVLQVIEGKLEKLKQEK